MRYFCKDCGETFDEDEALQRRVCLEDYYGVGGQFENSTVVMCTACPNCDSVEVDEIESWRDDDDEADEFDDDDEEGE